VKANEYRIVAFGGIRDLHLTVTNDSKFSLDEVVVELQYLKPSEQPLRTDNIRFKSIAPNSSATLKIPDTNRGIKVSYRILRVSSDAAENAGM
jgi:serine/threonine-protein kinase